MLRGSELEALARVKSAASKTILKNKTIQLIPEGIIIEDVDKELSEKVKYLIVGNTETLYENGNTIITYYEWLNEGLYSNFKSRK